jgi:hypothetical protein
VFVRKDNSEEIEFRFSRFGGRAKGRFAIIIFAGLIALAILATMFFWWRLTASGIAFYNHWDGAQAMAGRSAVFSPLLQAKLKLIHAETQRRGGGVPDGAVETAFDEGRSAVTVARSLRVLRVSAWTIFVWHDKPPSSRADARSTSPAL